MDFSVIYNLQISALHGFAIFSFIPIVLSIFRKKGKYLWINQFDSIAVSIIRLIGISIILSWVCYTLAIYYQIPEYTQHGQHNLHDRLMGPYGITFFLMVYAPIISTQLLWFRRLKESMLFRSIMVILLLFGPLMELYTIVITNLHRDYISGTPAAISGIIKVTLLSWLSSFLAFTAVLVLIYFFLKLVNPFLNNRIKKSPTSTLEWGLR